MLKNKINGKIYIGQTVRSITKRFKQHQQKDSQCIAIYNAIQYHGWDNFEKDWYECPDEDLNFDEELLIREMGTLSPGGYNLKEGGGNGKLSKETKQKISEAQKGEKHHMFGKTHTEEAKKKNSDSTKGENNPNFGKTGENSHMFGKPRSEDTKKKISESQLGEKHYKSKRVYQYDFDDTLVNSFASTREAGRHLKKAGTHISGCANSKNKLKTAYGFKWSYIKF